MNDYVTSIIRTLVPAIVGTAATWVQVHFGWTVDGDASATVISMVTAASIGAYYALVRWAETKNPKIGWLLGLAKAPGYTQPE